MFWCKWGYNGSRYRGIKISVTSFARSVNPRLLNNSDEAMWMDQGKMVTSEYLKAWNVEQMKAGKTTYTFMTINFKAKNDAKSWWMKDLRSVYDFPSILHHFLVALMKR
jgi:hypothetical protein